MNAYERGLAAGLAGKSMSDCPYKGDARKRWVEGFDEGTTNRCEKEFGKIDAVNDVAGDPHDP